LHEGRPGTKMDKLRSQRDKVTYLVIFLAASSYYFLYGNLPAFKRLSDTAQLFGISWTILPLLLMLAYEKFGWKWINPEFDFAGYWDFIEDQFDATPDGEKYDYSAWGHLKIVQNTTSIRIVDGQTHKGNPDERQQPLEVSRWWSASCELDAENGVISATLHHESSPVRVGGAVLYGVEIFTVTKRGPREKPLNMSSKVYHCVGYGQPRIVAVRYTRREDEKGLTSLLSTRKRRRMENQPSTRQV